MHGGVSVGERTRAANRNQDQNPSNLRGPRRHGASRGRRTLQHDAAVDAVLLAARDENLIACREVAKHSWCLQGTGAPITPDGMIVPTEGTVVRWDAHSQEEAARPASLATQRETLDGSRW